MGVLKTVLIVIAVVVSLFWVLGFWAICSYNSKNAPKMDEPPQLDKLNDDELKCLFLRVKIEMVKRMNDPFDEFKK